MAGAHCGITEGLKSRCHALDCKRKKDEDRNACFLVKSHEPGISKPDQASACSSQMEQCKAYIVKKPAQPICLSKTMKAAERFHDSFVKEATETINARTEHNEREKLMLGLKGHLEAESNGLGISVIQWLMRTNARKEGLLQQTLLTTSQATNSQSVSSGISYCLEISVSAMTSHERNEKRLVQYKILKQALKGKAGGPINSIPDIGEKYAVASSHILINEIERLPRAQNTPRTCGKTLVTISSRIPHL
ncbi:hypothetical protein COOONC_00491 [Cooperia oncophora]